MGSHQPGYPRALPCWAENQTAILESQTTPALLSDLGQGPSPFGLIPILC